MRQGCLTPFLRCCAPRWKTGRHLFSADYQALRDLNTIFFSSPRKPFKLLSFFSLAVCSLKRKKWTYMLASACAHTTKIESRLAGASFPHRVNTRSLPLEGFQFGGRRSTEHLAMPPASKAAERGPNSARTPWPRAKWSSSCRKLYKKLSSWDRTKRAKPELEKLPQSQVGRGNTIK